MPNRIRPGLRRANGYKVYDTGDEKMIPAAGV